MNVQKRMLSFFGARKIFWILEGGGLPPYDSHPFHTGRANCFVDSTASTQVLLVEQVVDFQQGVGILKNQRRTLIVRLLPVLTHSNPTPTE